MLVHVHGCMGSWLPPSWSFEEFLIKVPHLHHPLQMLVLPSSVLFILLCPYGENAKSSLPFPVLFLQLHYLFIPVPVHFFPEPHKRLV